MKLRIKWNYGYNFSNVATELLLDKFRNIDVQKVCGIIRSYGWNEKQCNDGILEFSKVVTVQYTDEDFVTKSRDETRYCNLEPSVDYDALAERLDDRVLMNLGNNILSFVLTEDLDFDEFLSQVRKSDN